MAADKEKPAEDAEQLPRAEQRDGDMRETLSGGGEETPGGLDSVEGLDELESLDGPDSFDGQDAEEFQDCLSLVERVRKNVLGGHVEGIDTEPTDDEDGHEIRTIGRFQIIRELGRGGSGIVFLADDPHLGRRVALKVPRPEALLTNELRRRFMREAKAAAGLHHPGIVPIYEAGSAEAVCYIVAEYCQGETLGQWIAQQVEPVPERTAAHWAAQLADAMQHAHDKGVLHRDLKPGNVMLVATETGKGEIGKDADRLDRQPKLTDFGLAKILSSDATATRTGAVLGTPSYMAPEQAEGRLDKIDKRTDIYGLGTILHEMLTGQPPFKEETDVGTIVAVREKEPLPLSRIRRALARDLKAICLKCLEKRPRDRYDSAAELAADLRRFLAGEPTKARPLGQLQRASRWIRRNRMAASLMAVIVGSAMAMTFGALWHADRLASQLSANQQLRQQAEVRQRTERGMRYGSAMRLASTLWHQQNLGELVRTLERQIPQPGEEDLRSFVWHYLWQRCHNQLTTYRGHTGTVGSIAFSPDGKCIATVGNDSTARLFETESGRELAVLRGHIKEVNCVAFCSDGNQLVTGDSGGFVRPWDTESFEQEKVVQVDAEDVLCLAITPDGKVLATGGVEGVVRLWRLPELTPIGIFEKKLGWIRSLAFSPDGTRLALGENNKTARIYDWQEGVQSCGYMGHEHWVTSVAFHPNGKLLASGSPDRRVWLWNATESAAIQKSRSLAERIHTVRFSPDGKHLAIAGNFNHLEIWKTDDLLKSPDVTSEFEILAHVGGFRNVAFAPDGKTLVTAGTDGLAKRWRAADQRIDETWEITKGNIVGPEFDIRGELLALLFGDSVRVFDWERHVEVARFELPTAHKFEEIRISPNCQYLGMIGEGERLTVIPLRDEGESKSFGSSARIHSALAFSHDNSLVYVCDGTATLLAYAIDHSAEPIEIFSAKEQMRFARIGCSPDGRWLFAGDSISEKTAILYDLVDGRVHMTIEQYEGNEAFSADGRLLATTSTDGAIRIWDIGEGALRHTLASPGSFDGHLAFSPDGKLLASVARDLPLRFWSMELGEELLSIPVPNYPRLGLAFSDDGKTLITGKRYRTENQDMDFGRFLSYSAAAPMTVDAIGTEP